MPFAISLSLSLLTDWLRRRQHRRPTGGAVLVLCASLAGCQMNGAGLSSNSKNDDVKMPSTAIDETYGGDSGTEITLLMRKGAAGLYEGPARDVRDGAVLGVGELGSNQVRLRVKDVGQGPAGIAAQVAAAKSRNAALIVSYLPPAETAAIAAISPAQRPPLLNLASAMASTGGDVFNLASDEIDSATEGVKAAGPGGHKKVSALVPADFSPSDSTRLSNAIWNSGNTFMGLGRYNTSDQAADILTKNRPLIQSAEIVVILGNTPEIGAVASAVRSAAIPAQAVVGTNRWPQSIYAVSAVAGAFVATDDTQSSGLIAERYQRHFNHPLTTSGAYGYDAMAIASGLIRSQGPQAITTANLMNKVGFRGTTGLFRFNAAGMVERKMVINTIDGGKLKVAAQPSQSF
ncbi:periplasmic binding fold domain-containing protein (plasmid) [Rhizobium sp. NXC24]|nr:periplasmic binding fold domain-containing protein [Rhizobium sp. NXC24]